MGELPIALSTTESDSPQQFGKYQLLRLLARGGMGEVYLARLVGELGFEKRLVIKTILPQYASDPRFNDLFAREARTAVALSHGNIVPMYELGRAEGALYIVMGYVDGPSVSQLMAAWKTTETTPPIDVALHITRAVLNGLAYAHRGEPERPAVVHRDISPRNVLLDRNGNVRIVDFGIATPARTESKFRAGSVGYMAPEQARGAPADPRADVFSVGALLFAMLTGRAPFSTAGVWCPPDLEALPELVRAPVGRSLSLDPNDRPCHAADLLAALRPAMVEYVATFGDLELAHHIGQWFGPEWEPGGEPVPRERSQHLSEPEQTFATRLTAVTHLVPECDVEAANHAAISLTRGSISTGADERPIAFRPFQRRLLLVPVGLGLIGAAFTLGQLIDKPSPRPMQTWTPVASQLALAPREPSQPPIQRPDDDDTPPPVLHRDEPPPETPLATSPPPAQPTSKPSTKPPSRAPAELVVRAPSVTWAEVWVDGQKVGHTPTRKITLAPGRHDVEVRCTDACAQPTVLLRRTIRVTPGSSRTVSAP